MKPVIRVLEILTRFFPGYSTSRVQFLDGKEDIIVSTSSLLEPSEWLAEGRTVFLKKSRNDTDLNLREGHYEEARINEVLGKPGAPSRYRVSGPIYKSVHTM